jgi:hypothetical protein
MFLKNNNILVSTSKQIQNHVVKGEHLLLNHHITPSRTLIDPKELQMALLSLLGQPRQAPDLPLHPIRLPIGIIHPHPHPFLQLLVSHTPDPNLSVNAVFLRRPNHTHSHDDRYVADARNVGVEPALLDFCLAKGCCEGGGGGVYHGLGDGHGFGEDGAETDAGEDVHVVSWEEG